MKRLGTMNYTTDNLDNISSEFEVILNPMRVFNDLISDIRARDEQVRQAKLIEARKKYVYGFMEVEFDKLFGKDVYDLDHGHASYGYLTFKDEVISDYPIQMGSDILGFLDKLNEEYNEGKKYRIQEIQQVFKVSSDDSRKRYVCEKCIEDKKSKYIDDVVYILDIQNGEFVYNTNEHSYISGMYIYDNILKYGHKYVHIPTGKTVIDTSYMKYDVNATEIHDYNTINVDKYIIFSATKFNKSLRNRYDLAVKLDKITGEVTEIK